MNRKMKSVVIGFLVIALTLACIPFNNVNAAGLVGIDENSKSQTVAQGTKVSIDVSGHGSDVKYWLEIHKDSEDGEMVFSEFRWVDNLKQKYKDFHETFYWDTSNVKMSKYYVVVKVPYSSSVYSETKNIVIDQTDIYVVAPSHVEAPQIDGYTAMYRLFNNNTGEHFYTGSFYEEKTLVVRDGWSYEGVAWYAPNEGAPVYRLYNPYSGEHHYTSDVSEKDHLSKIGWNYEGIGWHTDDSGIPIYRLYNPNATGQYAPGAHHYTRDMNEVNHLASLGWNYEGIGWYGRSDSEVVPQDEPSSSEVVPQDDSSNKDNKYEQLKDYVVSNGVLQDDSYYWLIKFDDNNTFGICYKTIEDSFEFYVKNTSSITDSTLVMSTNGTITGTGQVMCASLGPVATGQVDISTYNKSTDIEVKPSDNQGMTNALLRIGFVGWEYMLTQYVGIHMKDVGFLSYSV